jgi:antitoxin (DNA-binding transcriptional repressor) of toxin-antitoxin stability system
MKYLSVAEARNKFTQLDEMVLEDDVVVTKHGKPIFRITNPRPVLGRSLSSSTVGDLLAACARLPELTDEDREAMTELRNNQGTLPQSPWEDNG